MAWEHNRPNHVPQAVREACLARDNHQCVETLNTGQRCPATTQLQAAHINQWQPGERTTVHMVRTLCHWHHNRETQAEAAQAKRNKARRTAKHPRDQHPGRR